MLLITKDWLKEKSACKDGYEWSLKHLNGKGMPVLDFVDTLIADDKIDLANWVLSFSFTQLQCVEYAIFAAEQVIDIFEKKYPEDKRPRKAIESARTYLENPSEINKKAAYEAYDASYAAYAAAEENAYAANSAYACAFAAAAAYAYDTYAYAAENAYSYASACADADAKRKLKLKIFSFGKDLLKR